jgi:hypothetical protein
MADFSMLYATLRRLTQEINQKLPAWLLGRPTNDVEADRRETEINNVADRLQLLIRDLKSRESLLRVQQSGMGRIYPRDSQNQAEWAQRQRTANLEGVREQAEGLGKLVNDQLRRNGLNPLQAANEFHDLIENLDKTFSQSEIANAMQTGQNAHSTIAPASPQHAPHMHPLTVLDTGVPALTFTWLLLRWIAAKAKRGKAKSA